jgi:hypothetical protein
VPTTNQFNGLGLPLETFQQQSFYTDSVGWDLTSTWAITNGKSYPYLQYQTAPITDGQADDATLRITAAANTEITVYKGFFGAVGNQGKTGFKGFETTPLLTYTTTAAGAQTIPFTEAMGVMNGTALYVVAKVAGKSASYPVRVVAVAEQRIRKLTITDNGVSLEQKNLINGHTLDLNVIIEPEDAIDKSVTWTSTNTSVATVDNDGIVRALLKGTTLIIVSSNNSQPVSDTCAITVITGVDTIIFSYDKDEIVVGTTLQITATVLPENAENRSITWTSSTPTVATVDNTGLVTATQRTGGVVITASATDGSGKKTTLNLMVVKETVTPGETGITSAAKESLLVYPNPVTNGQLIVANGQWKAGDRVELYDLLGRLVLSTRLSGVQATVNVSSLPQGAYIVKLGNKTALIQKK